MTNFVAAERDRAQRIQGVAKLVKVIQDAGLAGSVAVVNDAVYGILPSSVTVRLGNKYLALASVAFSQAAKWRLDYIGGERLLTCFFEQGREAGQDEVRRIMRIVADNS
jgi:hypothetical protein